ncbi:hypothetical protein S40285_04401 [Stachybotrys chlorohalonatus IBT 40285]|uniref:Rhodopsin domain-containing protein n=1 Tax=Stachybotrys chlorohalonatus (strain IBT 40285) TaxID=1283841 RepID=A0A084R1U8_STAC4|nr:hypothetical protein S40285_04401 [Stachybotrys chlorohalonata IBT 40285]
MDLHARNHVDEVHRFISPYTELNAGLWTLFAGTTVLLALRIWIKTSRKHRLWYDDHILIVTWFVLMANNSLIVYEFGNGYVLEDSTHQWDDRMRILINISSCGTLIGQAWSKTAFGVTLLRLGTRRIQWVVWFCIITMNLWMVVKLILQWAQICDKGGYDAWWRLDFCVSWRFREDFKEGGNVWNIIMDFVFATIPWFIIRKLELRQIEKIGLAVVMSLGMVVAIVSAVRVAWKDNGNGRDEWYMWRNGISQVWYSSEITGTIMVQCIPVLRTFIREIQATMSSQRLSNKTNTDPRSSRRISGFSKRISSGPPDASEHGGKWSPRIELKEVPESPLEHQKEISFDDDRTSPVLYPSRAMSWPFPREDTRPARSMDDDRDTASLSSAGYEYAEEVEQGLTPTPARHRHHNSY